MSTVWKKILHIHKKNHHGSITSLRIPEHWPHIGEDINTVKTLENPKKANEWRLIEMLHEIAHYLGFEIDSILDKPEEHLLLFPATNSTTSELILDGHYNNKEFDVLTTKLLEHCKKEHNSIKLGEKFQFISGKKN
eukprot:13530176-Ditylum_brightwellii.AAC.1